MVVFSEDHTHETCRRGRIEVVCGSMFSGKTEELIRRLKRATFARQRVEIFKPAIVALLGSGSGFARQQFDSFYSGRLVGKHPAVQLGN